MTPPRGSTSALASSVRRWELKLLALFLLSRVYLLWAQFGVGRGFDISAHREMIPLLSWLHPATDIRATFYGYHPPIGFLLPRTLTLLGIPDIGSVQIVSMAASLVAFFALREILRRLDLLSRVEGVLFLYGAVAIPLHVFLSHSLNLDVIVLACAALAFLAGIERWWTAPFPPRRRFSSMLLTLGTVTAIAVALLTKFSGLLLLSIPFIVAILAPGGLRAKLRPLAWATFAACLAVALTLPYYGVRYYRTEGTLFPNNGDWMIPDSLRIAREARDADPAGFFLKLLEPVTVHETYGLVHRDLEVIRLRDAWRDFWIEVDYLGRTNPIGLRLGTAELAATPWLAMAGLGIWIAGVVGSTVWNRLGAALLLYGAVQIAAFVAYLYQNPFAGWGPSKGIYVAPVAWLVAFLLASVASLPRLLPPASAMLRLRIERGMMIAMAALLALHHFLPVY